MRELPPGWEWVTTLPKAVQKVRVLSDCRRIVDKIVSIVDGQLRVYSVHGDSCIEVPVVVVQTLLSC